jgi:hypothetical protein
MLLKVVIYGFVVKIGLNIAYNFGVLSDFVFRKNVMPDNNMAILCNAGKQ